MRIVLFFILIFTGFVVLADEAPNYWGQTGMSVPARNFESPQQLKWFLLPDNSTDRDFKEFREYVFDNFMKAVPRIELMLRIRDRLPDIIEAYVVRNRSELSDRFYYYIHRNTEAFSDSRVNFDFDSKGRFQVDGIEPDRLGIHTESGIYFNVDGINKKQSFTVGEVVQLWMHEILHADSEIPLAERDAWTAKFAQWVQERTSEIEVGTGRKVISLNLPRTPNEVVSESDIKTSRSFLIFEMDKQGTRLLNQVYDGFATFGNFLNWKMPAAIRVANAHVMPLVEVSSIRKTARNSLQIEYRQDSIYFNHDSKSGYFRGYEGIGFNGASRPPEERFRMEWFPETGAYELSRAYTSELAGDDFEIYRVKDQGGKRFLSIRINTQNMQAFLKSKTLHLLARNAADGKTLSFEIGRMRPLNKQELLVHVQIPQTSMEISQILMEDNSGERYSETAIRPSQPARLQGPEMSHLPIKNLKAIEIKTRKIESDKALIRIQLKSGSKIKGVSFDLEHFIQGYKYIMQNGRMEDSLKIDFGMGRKFYLRRSEVQMSKDGWMQFEIPNVLLDKYQRGPTYSTHLGLGQYYNHSEKLAYLRDNLERKLAALWIHYEDGRVEKAPTDLVPRDWVSIQSDEARNRVRMEKAKAESRAWRDRLLNDQQFFKEFGFDDNSDDDRLPEVRTCEGLF